MPKNLIGLLISWVFQLSNAGNNLTCYCDETTAFTARRLPCYYTLQNDEYELGCECASGFSNIRLNKENGVVSCRPTFPHGYPLSVKCFCDHSSAVKIKNEDCLAYLFANGSVLYESGCECMHPKARPTLVKEFFLSHVYVVHCVLENDALGLTSLNDSSFKIRDKRQENEPETSESPSTTMESSIILSTIEETTPTESTTELLSSSEPSTPEITTEPTTELITEPEPTTEEEPTSETTRRTSTPRPTSTTRGNVTIVPITVTTPESDGEINFGVCNSTSFSNDDKKTAQIFLYVASAWVFVWIILIILINLWCRSWGHHRFLDLLQEIGLIVAFVFMGFFTLRPDLTGLCKATQIVLQFVIMYFLINAIFQSFFLNGLIKGRSTKNSCVPWVFNYTIPLILSGGLTAGFYFWMKSDYDGNGVHCFCEIYTDLYWTFVFPAWVFGFTAIFFNQTSITACKMSRSDVNLDQLFWAKKMCRGLPIYTTWFSMCFFMLLFGVELQRLWIIGVYMGLCILFGPIFFILHTFCYERTAVKMYMKTSLAFYKPCPQKASETDDSTKDTKVDLRTRHPMTDPIVPLKGTDEKADLPPQPVGALTTLNPPMETGLVGTNPNEYGPLEYDPTSPNDLYKWLTDRNAANVTDGENILFKKNV